MATPIVVDHLAKLNVCAISVAAMLPVKDPAALFVSLPVLCLEVDHQVILLIMAFMMF